MVDQVERSRGRALQLYLRVQRNGLFKIVVSLDSHPEFGHLLTRTLNVDGHSVKPPKVESKVQTK